MLMLGRCELHGRVFRVPPILRRYRDYILPPRSKLVGPSWRLPYHSCRLGTSECSDEVDPSLTVLLQVRFGIGKGRGGPLDSFVISIVVLRVLKPPSPCTASERRRA